MAQSVRSYHNGRLISSISEILSRSGTLCSVSQALRYEPNVIFLASFSPKLAYLSMLFSHELAYTGDNAGQLTNK